MATPPRPESLVAERFVAPARPRRAQEVREPLGRNAYRVLAAGVGAAVVLVAMRVAGVDSAAASTIIYGSVSALAGVWAMAPGTGLRYASRWRIYLGASLIMWGIGQLVSGLQFATGTYRQPSIGDVVAMTAAPLLFAGITRAVRSSAFVLPVLRIVIDAIMIGAALGVLAWRFGAMGRPDLAGGVGAFTAAIVLIDGVVGAFGILVFIRRPAVATCLFAFGLSSFAFADVAATLRADLASAVPLLSAATFCIAMAAFAVGARCVEPEADDDLRRDMRQATGAVVITATLVAIAMVHVVTSHKPKEWPPVIFMVIVVVAYFVRYVVDHRQRTVMFSRLSQQALTDHLTGIGNRFVLDELDRSDLQTPLDVVVVGIDGLSAFANTLGHEEGDALVRRVATALDQNFADMTVVRLAADEFAVVHDLGVDTMDVAARAREVAEAAAQRNVEATAQVRMTAGAAHAEHDAGDVLATLARAQRARHLARRDAGGPVRLYDDAIRARDERDRLIDTRLPHAIEAGLITAHYQPVVSLATGQVVGVEALARWTDPLLGVVGPDEFVPRAEAADLIQAMGLSIVRQAAEVAVALALPRRGVPVGVNVSVSQLRHHIRGLGYADALVGILDRVGLAPEQLVIEVTESMLIEEHDPAIDELRVLAHLGTRIAVDDFGSGFWALGYFRWFNADIVKIDRSLIVGLADDERSQAVVASIVGLCDRLGMETIAEGTEDHRVIDVARNLGVTSAQGWAYARAVPAGELTATIERIEGSPFAGGPALAAGSHEPTTEASSAGVPVAGG